MFKLFIKLLSIKKKNRYLNINRINSLGSKIKSLTIIKVIKKYITSNKNSRERVVKKRRIDREMR